MGPVRYDYNEQLIILSVIQSSILFTFFQVHDPERQKRSDPERSSRSDQANLHRRNDDGMEIHRDGSDER